MRSFVACAAVATLLSSPAAFAQQDRRDLAERLQRFEALWEKSEPADRARALAVVPDAAKQFLSLRSAEAGRTLDKARRKLISASDDSIGAWADAVSVRAGPRVVDVADAGAITFTAVAAYPVKGDVPAGLTLRIETVQCCVQPAPEPTEVPLTALPMTVEVKHTPRDGTVARYTVSVLRYGVHVAPVARVERLAARDLPGRLAKLKVAADAARKAVPQTLETATLAELSDRLRGLAAGDVPETEAPGGEPPALSRLGEWWRDAEAIAAAPGAAHFKPVALPAGLDTPRTKRDAKLVGTFAQDESVSVPTAGTSTPCRVSVPAVGPGKRAPVVLALHGAGGSENLFFDGYGAGCVVSAARDRGWFVVSPRSGLFGSPPSRAILEELAKRYPIDLERVFVVGHSMGAAQAVELAQAKGFPLKAVAALGGGGRVRDAKVFAELPVFVGVGTADFALKNARSLGQSLTDGGAKRVTVKEYADVEHLLIVRAAVEDVFTAWDDLAAK